MTATLFSLRSAVAQTYARRSGSGQSLLQFRKLSSSTVRTHIHRGSCHCGNIQSTFETSKSPAELGSRSCTCSWCSMQGSPSHTSDSAGRVTIATRRPQDTSRYRMGTGTAEFLGCTNCHVVPVITWRAEEDGRLYSVLRVQTLSNVKELMEYDRKLEAGGESVDERLERRKRTWTPTVLVEAKGVVE